ncbi:MAG: 2-C-methyl-D-erythritol 2,4-cyclodiphosphate synthase [Thermodesulfovibrionales bacterium]
MQGLRTGIGYDSHRFAEGRKLILGGIEIPFSKGLLGHSDGDCLCHAIIDSLLGAAGMPNIGQIFPDTDPEWKDVKSTELLSQVLSEINKKGFRLLWIDSVIIAEEPRLNPYIPAMKKALSETGIPEEIINIKPKTNEAMGFIGRKEGIAVIATCLIEGKD